MNKKYDIENFNKKSLYILIREMTDVKTSDITKVVNIFKTHYFRLIKEYNIYDYRYWELFFLRILIVNNLFIRI